MNLDKAVRYHQLKRRAGIAATLLTGATLAALLLSGASARLRDVASAGVPAAHSAATSPAAIGVYVVLLSAILQVLSLPLAYYTAVVLDRRYGLSSESTGRWMRDQIKAALISGVVAVGAAEVGYLTIRRWPQMWWVAAALACGAAVLLLTRAAPVVLLPLFYRFKPLERPPLQERLRTISTRAGMPVLGVYEWGLGDKTRRANAALVGVGGTRRILLSDTLLSDYSDDEIEVILAHELGHHAHRDVLTAVAAQTGVLLAGFAAAAGAFEAIERSGWRTGFTGRSDVAGLPLLLLATGGVSMLMAPLLNALSRLHERRADVYALRVTERPAAFVSAMRRLGAQNLAEPQPSRAVVWLFHSHPPVEERIARARGFAKEGV